MWEYDYAADKGTDPTQVIGVMCCDVVNRGLAYGDGKVFLAQGDATLIALDAKTGKLVWKVKNGDPKAGMTNTNAPLVVKDKVFVGISCLQHQGRHAGLEGIQHGPRCRYENRSRQDSNLDGWQDGSSR